MSKQKSDQKYIFHTEQRKVSDLIPYEKNPRKISEKQAEDLKKSLEKFGLASIPVINTDNKVCAGHQRLKILQLLGRGDELIDVRVPNKKMSEKDFQEYNIRDNKNIGEFDFDILVDNFNLPDLLEWGFEDYELWERIETEQINYKEAWGGMPEFTQENVSAKIIVIVHFWDEDGVKKFAKIIDQKVTPKTKHIYFPKQPNLEASKMEYISES